MRRHRIEIGRRAALEERLATWVRDGEAPKENPVPRRADANTARLTIDVTPELRGRIKVAAFRAGYTVADLLRNLLEQHFPETPATPTQPQPPELPS